MVVQTRYFGEIDLTEEKIITFENGIMGFENYKRFTILYDVEKEEKPSISWLQSLDEKNFALPVVNPMIVKEDYNPVVEDELLKSLGDLNEENVVILLIMTIPSDITKITANLKAPIIINSDSKKGCQIIVENQDYPIKFNVYNMVQKMKENKGDE
ncbi:MAG: flagellar assembly protein FliW [Acetivibrio sp.]